MAFHPTMHSLKPRWCPAAMSRPPVLDAESPAEAIRTRYALLINPFYPKDPNASFGKHVLTPTLALTSFAATTPRHWEVRYWDENLLDGRPPFRPMPEVVGIKHHLVHAVWGPMVELTRLRHLRLRKDLASGEARNPCSPGFVNPGVQRLPAGTHSRTIRASFLRLFHTGQCSHRSGEPLARP